MIERIGSKDEIRSAVTEARRESKTIGFVPTMGALHEGHLSLVRAACDRTDFVIVSIFVNPTQFAPGEDFERYPRRMDADIALLAAEGAELVFTPTIDTMYGPNPQVSVEPGPLAERWEGEIRPGHFSGVATIVAKLLGVVRPDLAFFGEKDYQQLRIVHKLAEDLDIGVGIVDCPIVREPDGLAMSSRNAYLTPEERAAGLGLSEALHAAVEAAAWGEHSGNALQEIMRRTVAEKAGARIELDYAAVVDPNTLEPLDELGTEARALIAGRVGGTRLIDNCPLTVSP